MCKGGSKPGARPSLTQPCTTLYCSISTVGDARCPKWSIPSSQPLFIIILPNAASDNSYCHQNPVSCILDSLKWHFLSRKREATVPFQPYRRGWDMGHIALRSNHMSEAASRPRTTEGAGTASPRPSNCLFGPARTASKAPDPEATVCPQWQELLGHWKSQK